MHNFRYGLGRLAPGRAALAVVVLSLNAFAAAAQAALTPAAATPAATPSVATGAPLDETKLLRFPATDGKQIVFSFAGQLYSVALSGGTARRLTDGPGYAIFPRFSADGSQLAFTAQYDGNTEVYAMPAAGGTPKRITYSATLGRDDLADRMGPNNIVLAWRNTVPEIAFRSRWKSFNPFLGELCTVGLDAEVPRTLPVPRGGFMTFSPDDTKIAYNRVFREFRTWKQYRGGMADDVWIYDLKSGALENITNHPAQDLFPMWAPNGKIYFVSERDGRANLYSYALATKQTAQHTKFTDFDVKFPSLGAGGIVFEQAGGLWHLDLATEKIRRVPVVVQEDFATRRSAIVATSGSVQGIAPAPDGQRVVLVARGDVYTAPLKNGPTRNLTRTSGAHERDATWSPDGKWIAYLSDVSGEDELLLQAQDGKSPATALTAGSAEYFYAPQWSPDSRKLAWWDAKRRLRVIDVESKAVSLVAELRDQAGIEFDWSPDSQWLAYVEIPARQASRIVLQRLGGGERLYATDAWYASNSPRFSDDGKWLLFASGRDFRPIYSDTEWNHAYLDMERVYMVALARDTVSPLAPKSDETGQPKTESPPEEKSGEKKNGDEKKAATDSANAGNNSGNGGEAEAKKPEERKPAKSTVAVRVDADGLLERIVGLPVPPSNYSRLRLVGDRVFYRRVPGGPVGGGVGGEGFGATRNERSVLASFHLKDLKETELGNFDDFELTRDGKKVLFRSGGDYALVDLPTGQTKLELKEKLNFGGLESRVDRVAEWRQIYHESWRQMRDLFYAENLHGVDWKAQHDKYAALLPHVAHRNDLTYLIGELIGELHAGHTYVGGGDRPQAPRVKMGLLGAQLSRDAASRAYRIDHIVRGENWQASTRSPLTEMGVNVSEGDYILAIDGQPVAALENIYSALAGTAGKQITLRVNRTPSDAGARDVVVVPVADEAPLYQEEWVRKNIDHVSAKTNGAVGYVWIPDMGPQGLNEFVRRYYPQITRRALILDVRGNGGGNVSPMIVERLARTIDMVNSDRYRDAQPNPAAVHVGPKVTLLNEFSASDGDIFPHRFREHGLGKLIGKRSWGGVVGIPGSLPFVDGGVLNTPVSGPYAKDGSKWIIEGYGVDPDIVVDNDPAREFRGEDQQLDKAIEVILEELKKSPQPALPPRPAWPDKK